MLSKKLLSIQECQFSLPDDFDGTLGDALMLLAEYRLKCEASQKVNQEDPNITCYEALEKDDNIKCSIKYFLTKRSEDGTQWEVL